MWSLCNYIDYTIEKCTPVYTYTVPIYERGMCSTCNCVDYSFLTIEKWTPIYTYIVPIYERKNVYM